MVYNPSHRQLIQSRVNGYWQMDLSYCPNGASLCTTNNGNIRQIVLNDTMATRTQNFSYDSANRLQTAAEANGFAQTYGYDQYSNRWITPTSSLPGGNFQPTSAAWFDAATNRLQSAVGNTYFHDAAGNMIAEAATTFAYDAEGRMIRSTIPYATGTVITQYFYDGEGRRVKKQNQALGKTLYLYDAFGRLAVEFPEQAFAPCTTCYLYTDQVNTTRLVLDQGGTVMKRADHMPFGEEILNGAPWANGRGSLYADNNPVRQQFTGYLRNEPYEWALDFANARYYRRSNGRFTSPDQPLIDQHENDAQSWNLYSYVRNNPLRLIDPSGQVCVSPGGGNPDYDDPSLPSPTCKEVKDQDKALRPSVSVSPDWDELRLMMMRGVGESLSSPQAWSSIGRGAMENAYPIQSTIVECAASAIGGNCPSSDSEILYAAAVKPKFAQAAARVARLWAITKPAATKVIGGRTYMKDAKTGTWWSRDTAGHGGSAWKVYREKPGGALEWMADADAHGNFVSGKHKSSIGTLLR